MLVMRYSDIDSGKSKYVVGSRIGQLFTSANHVSYLPGNYVYRREEGCTAYLVGEKPRIFSLPPVPRFSDAWTDQMIDHVWAQSSPQDYVRLSLPAICRSWGDSSKRYAVESILLEVGLLADSDCQDVLDWYFD